MIICIIFIIHWYLSLFSQTFFLHRYSAHQSFKMSRKWERFFFVFTYLTQGSSYLSPRAYAILHRLHHAYTDQEQDPHSPSYDGNVFKMMWRTRRIYNAILYGQVTVDDKFKKNVPEWNSFDRWGNSWLSRLLWVGIYAGMYIIIAPPLFCWLLLPLQIMMSPMHGVIINWFAHKYGTRNFDTDNTSRNLLKVDWLMLGEGYHNNHHMYPARANFAAGKGEFDFCYPVIVLLKKLRIVR